MGLFWYPDRHVDLDKPDKEQLHRHYVMTMLNRLQSMFKYDGLPDTVPQKWLENYLLCNGSCLWVKDGSDLIVTNAAIGGIPDRYYFPSDAIVANPYVKESTRGTYKIGEKCVLMRNDIYMRGVLPLLEEHARLLTENYVTMNLSTILARAMLTITALDNQSKESVELWLKKLIKGDISAIGELPSMIGNQDRSINITPFQSVAGILTDLIEERQYVKASFFNELGLNSNYNMKRESINSNESQLNDDMLHPLIDTMLAMRKEALEEVNAMFGTNITVEFNSAWKDNEIENDLMLETMEAETEATEKVEAAPENEEQVLINGTETEEDAEVVEDKVETEAETTEEVKEDQPEEQTEEEQPVELVEAVTELTEAVEDIAEVLSEGTEEEQKEGEDNV